MNKIILLSLLVLSGCATTQNPSVLVKPEASIMQDCSTEKTKFKEGMTQLDLADMIAQERKLRKECIELNKKKKEYIENLFKENR